MVVVVLGLFGDLRCREVDGLSLTVSVERDRFFRVVIMNSERCFWLPDKYTIFTGAAFLSDE
jgi:hypothetical protein